MSLRYFMTVLGLLCGLSWTGYGELLAAQEGAQAPAKVEPAKAEATKIEPAKAAPAKAAPAKIEGAKTEPAKAETATTEPAKAEPAKAAAAKPAKPRVAKTAKKVAGSQSETTTYQVKQGDHLFKILREQLGLKEKDELLQAFNQVKALNPQKTNWDTLVAGEHLTLPGKSGTGPSPKAIEGVFGLARNLPAKDNLTFLDQLVEIFGSRAQLEGEEVLPLKEGTVRLNRRAFPVVQDMKMNKKIILDLEGGLSPSLKSRVESQVGATVVSLKKGGNLHDAVGHVLSRMGYQSLPLNRPVVIQDAGVEVQVKGEWMVLSPETGGARQDMWIVNLTDAQGKIPDYLRDYLSVKGMNLREVTIPATMSSAGSMTPLGAIIKKPVGTFEIWPADKVALVDAFLRGHEIHFFTDHPVMMTLREGALIETQLDRYFEVSGKKFALLFRPATDEVRKGLQETQGLTLVEFDIGALSSRELISRLFQALGQAAKYRDNYFPAADGPAKEKVVVKVAGFHFPERSLLLTDRDIPDGLLKLFLDKGLRVIRFR